MGEELRDLPAILEVVFCVFVGVEETTSKGKAVFGTARTKNAGTFEAAQALGMLQRGECEGKEVVWRCGRGRACGAVLSFQQVESRVYQIVATGTA